MGFNGEAPAQSRGLPLSPKAQEVLTILEALPEQQDAKNATLVADDLLRSLYEPALAVAAAINLVRQGNTGMAPFVGSAGVVLSQALGPLVEHFGDEDLGFEQAFERIGIPVVRYTDLPDVPEVETPAAAEE
jgi:hypothetical protein